MRRRTPEEERQIELRLEREVGEMVQAYATATVSRGFMQISRLVAVRTFARVYERLLREDAEMNAMVTERDLAIADEMANRATDLWMSNFHREMGRFRN